MGLGLPLPKGVLRAFQEQGENRHFLGEAPIEATPAGEAVEVRLGQVFDVTVERAAVEYEKTGKNSYRCTWELRIKNAKAQKQHVVLKEQLPGTWKVQSASHKWSKPAAGVLEFGLDVPAKNAQDPLLVKYTFTTEL
jgi:hypothetical protein